MLCIVLGLKMIISPGSSAERYCNNSHHL